MAELAAAAGGLLVSGVDTPNLRILAGEDRAEADDVERVLRATLRDLGLVPLERREAVLAVARRLAHEGAIDEASAETVAPTLWRLFAREPMSVEWPDTFVRLAYAADAVEDLPDWSGSLPEFLEAAREFLDDQG
ncbi:MAG: hypothetical protein H0U52_14615 [Chloroflexi bacterium]|nr:hypothetical protein [Chloroflexota bacterium]